MSLTNVTIINDRVENIGETAHMVSSRAFTAPEDFLRIAEPLCAKNGLVAVMLGLAERLPDELSLSYLLEELIELDVPGTDFAARRNLSLC